MTRSVFDDLRQLPQRSFEVGDGVSEPVDAAALLQRVATLATGLQARGASMVALHADNGIDWIVADLACDRAGIAIVPLPPFFSPDQIAAVIAGSGVDTLLTDRSAWFRSNFDCLGGPSPAAGADSLEICPVTGGAVGAVPAGTRKITYTSGTTGSPKGVCLSAAHQLTVAESLIAVTRLASPRHLCTLPLATLLENIAGVYGPLLAGGTVIVPSLASLGFNGSSQLDLSRFLQTISDVRPDSLILVPETLKMLVMAVHRGWQAPDSLKFVAVGGGKVATTLICEARACGLPVHEGYGLSECGSVVSLNAGHDDLPGSVGKPLPHVSISINDSEIVVAGASHLGYVGDPESWGRESVRTGDIGHVDADGRLFIDGRRKNVLITSFGRNISPEWVESELLAGDALRHAWVFGDAEPYCVAFVVAVSPAITDDRIETWIGSVNSRLPDYARIAKWHRVDAAVDDLSRLLTANGRPRRDLIEQRFQPVLDAMYQPKRKESVL
jgi:long-subunit acyl-CoA synthetase (AMP-forming)